MSMDSAQLKRLAAVDVTIIVRGSGTKEQRSGTSTIPLRRRLLLLVSLLCARLALGL